MYVWIRILSFESQKLASVAMQAFEIKLDQLNFALLIPSNIIGVSEAMVLKKWL